jgi:hypothetical protein
LKIGWYMPITHIPRATEAKIKEDTTTALRLFRLSFTDLWHSNENIPKEAIPSDIENQGLMAKVVRVDKDPPNSINILLNSAAILWKYNNPEACITIYTMPIQSNTVKSRDVSDLFNFTFSFINLTRN